MCRPGSALHSAVKRAIGSERESPGGPGAVSYVHTYTRCARYRLPHWNGNTRAGRGGRLYLESSQAGRRKELAWLGGARRGAAGMCLARPVWVTGRRPRLTVQPLPKTFSPGRRGPRAIVPGRGSLLTAAPACTPPKVKLVELMGLISGSSSIEWLRYSAVQWYSVRCRRAAPGEACSEKDWIPCLSCLAAVVIIIRAVVRNVIKREPTFPAEKTGREKREARHPEGF